MRQWGQILLEGVSPVSQATDWGWGGLTSTWLFLLPFFLGISENATSQVLPASQQAGHSLELIIRVKACSLGLPLKLVTRA